MNLRRVLSSKNSTPLAVGLTLEFSQNALPFGYAVDRRWTAAVPRFDSGQTLAVEIGIVT